MNSHYVALVTSFGRSTVRDFATLFFGFLFPPVLLVVFSQMFGSGTAGDHAVADALGPNVVAFGVAFSGVFASAMSLVEWRKNGMMRVLRVTPTSSFLILTALMTVGIFTALVQSLLVITVGVSPLVGMSLSAWSPFAIAGIILTAFVFFSIGILIGIIAPSVESTSLIIMAVVLPMGFASGAMVPLQFLPDWINALSRFLPLHYSMASIAGPLTGQSTFTETLIGLVVLAGLGVLAFAISRRVLKWS